jgi:hypothetical protein
MVPRITVHPQGAAYTIDAAALALTVSAEVDDNGSLSCQWYRNDEDSNEGGTELEGATEWRYTPPAVSPGVVYYYAIITNTLNEKTAEAASNTARIEIHSRIVTGMVIAAQPSQLTYTHGDALDLDGLALTVTYNNGSSENIPFADFAAKGISTSPAHGETLPFVTYNGMTVLVFLSGFTAETNKLRINRAIPVITFPTAAAITYGAALSDSLLSGGSVEAGVFAWARSWEIPHVSNPGFDVEFTPFDTDNYDYTGLTGWNYITGKLTQRVAIAVSPAIISEAIVDVYGPETGKAPSAWASVLGHIYVNSRTTWEPNDSTFLGDQAYTATVTLQADANYIFTPDMTGTINDNPAEITINNDTQVTLTFTFRSTNSKTIIDFKLRQPHNVLLTYTHNETLNLTGLTTIFYYDDNTTDQAYPADPATARGVIVNYAHDLQLDCTVHNGRPLTVAYGTFSPITVGILTVNKLPGADVTKPTLAANGIGATSIKINASSLLSATGQSIEYAASMTLETNENAANLIWGVPANLQFTNLTANMTYYVYARSKEDATHYAGAINYIVVPLQAFTINMEQIMDAGLNLTSPLDPIILYRTREPHTATITITNATGYTINWYYSNSSSPFDSGATVTLDVNDMRYGWPGRKYITVIATRTGYPPSSIRFELITYN